MCVCVCVCIYIERASERERERAVCLASGSLGIHNQSSLPLQDGVRRQTVCLTTRKTRHRTCWYETGHDAFPPLHTSCVVSCS